jgi:23S rRNA pseudouridine1911/1915/1917 synthase
LAVVEGIPSPQEATLEHYLVHDDYQARVSDRNDPNAKLARLHYRVVQHTGHKALLEIVLETGRYHQIRAQLAACGHPIVGDSKYGSRIAYIPGMIALHHYRLAIPHPITHELQTFEAKLPTTWPI